MRFLRLSAVAAMLFSLVGCAGYQLGPIKPKPYKDITSIAVPTFKNDTLEPRIEVLLANSVIKQIQQDGTYRVTDEKHADAVLECTLDSIVRRSSRSVRGNILQTREYTLTLRVIYTMRNRLTGAQIDRRTVSGSTNFFVNGTSILASDVNQDERQAIPLAAEDMAVHLTSLISEGW